MSKLNGQTTQSSPQDHLQPILLKGGNLAALSALGTIAALILTILLARTLGATKYGIFAALSELFILLVIPTQIGLPLYLVKSTASNLELGKHAAIKTNFRYSWQASMGLSALVATGLVVYWQISGNPHLLWGLLIVPITSIQGIMAGALRGEHKVVEGKLAEMLLIQVAFLLMTIVAIKFDASSFDLRTAFASLAAAQAFGLAITTLFFIRSQPTAFSGSDPGIATRPQWSQLRPFFFLDAIFTLLKRAPVVLVAAILLPNEVGNFKLALQMVGISEFGLRVFNPLLAPQIAGLFQRGDKSKLQWLATFSTRAILAANVVVAVIFIFVGKQLISWVFGNEFAPTYGVLMVLLVGQVFNSLTGAAEIFLLMTGLENDTAWFKGFCLALLLGAITIGANIMGTMGAAAGMSLAMMVWNLGLWYILLQKRQIDTLPLPFLRNGGNLG